MYLEKKAIIFGAGKNGEKILYRLGAPNIAFFCDNFKAGTEFHSKKVVDFSALKNGNQHAVCDVILSVNDDSIRSQLSDGEIRWWESTGMKNNFFQQKEIYEALDQELLDEWLTLDDYDGEAFRNDNWFRESYLSERNKQLVSAMKTKDEEAVSRIFSDAYDIGERMELCEDEYYDNRPGMRLIAQVIRRDMREKVSVCDLACGHGEFLKALQGEQTLCYGVDISVERCQSLADSRIDCRLGSVENTGYEGELFDYVTMMECLEHVQNPFAAIEEAYRILRRGGIIFVTVPYGLWCESDMHVRHFYEDDLYSVAKKCGYTDIKIMKLPYINSSFEDNLIMSAKKV